MKGFLILLLSFHVLAADSWKVEKINDNFFLKKSNGAKYDIAFDAGEPQFVEEKQLNKNYSVVIYQSGEVGTSKIISVKRCLLFKKGKFLANLPFEYQDKKTKETMGPEWSIQEDKVEVKDLNTGRVWSF